MRFQPGILACLLAGCVWQPTASTPTTPASEPLALVPHGHVLRIGLEYLPPDESMPAGERMRVEPRNQPQPTASSHEPILLDTPTRNSKTSSAPWLSTVDLDAIEDPIARETMHFVSDLVAADRQRVRREIGIPFFDFPTIDADRSLVLTNERRLLEDQELWIQERGTDLLRRPMRQLLRRLPIAREFDIAFEDFRSDHVPLTEPYLDAHSDRRSLGRMSLRVHPDDTRDPVEVVYVNSGVRVGTGQGRGKLSVDFDLSNSLTLSFRARTNYVDGSSDLRTDLIYRPSSHMSVHLAAGDDMDFLSTSSIYSLFESPMDGSPGLVLYAVHTF